MTTNGHDYSINHKLNNISKDNTSKENVNEIGSYICNYCCKMFRMNRLDFIVHQNGCKEADHSESPITIRWMKKKPLIREQEEDGWYDENKAHREYLQKKKEKDNLKRVIKNKRMSLYDNRPPTR